MFGKKLGRFGRRRPVREKSSKLYEEAMRPKAPKYEVPSVKPLLSFGAYVLLMGAAGIAALVLGQPVFGIGALIIGVLPAVLVAGLAQSLLHKTLGRREAVQMDELGDQLGEGGSALVRRQSEGLSASKLEALEKNRAVAADEAHAWLDGLGADGAACTEFETVEIEAEDGVHLVGYVLACNPESDLWFVFAHGLDGTWRAGMTYAARCANAGFNLLFVEMRAHGASGGNWVGASWLERRDLVCWCRWLVGRVGEGARIALAGQSLGAASAIAACGEKDLPPQVKACVSDSGFSDWWNLAVRTMATGSMGMQSTTPHPLLDLMRLVLRTRKDGYDMAKARPVDAIAHSKVPVLLIRGAGDRVVEPHLTDKLVEAAGGAAAGEGCELVTIPAAGHCCAVFADPEAYWAAVLGFFKRWM